MFGLTLTKILFTIAIVVVIWRGFRWWRTFEARRVKLGARRAADERQLRGNGRPGGRRFDRRARDDAPAIEDTEPCPVCQTYVPSAAPVSCGRSGCPYPN